MKNQKNTDDFKIKIRIQNEIGDKIRLVFQKLLRKREKSLLLVRR